MSRIRFPMLAVAAALAACASLPENYPPLETARAEYRTAAANPMIVQLAPTELEQAQRALQRAEALRADGADATALDHAAYLAGQRARVAQATAAQRAAERAVAQAGEQRNKVLLAARERDARDAEVARQQQALAAERARDQATAERARSAELEARVRALQGALEDARLQQTERGVVLTLGTDVLFDTGRADLKPGAQRSIAKIAEFLRENPKRTIVIEGFTDSTGNAESNQLLSERRAQAVGAAVAAYGIERARIQTRGYGDMYPVATNDTAAGRQLNRRVEIVVPDEGRPVATRR